MHTGTNPGGPRLSVGMLGVEIDGHISLACSWQTTTLHAAFSFGGSLSMHGLHTNTHSHNAIVESHSIIGPFRASGVFCLILQS